MADYNLGTARGTIELEYKGDGPDKAKRDLDDLTKKSGDTSAAYDKVGGTMQKAGAAIGAGIGLAIKSAADFEQKMSAIKAVSGASGQEMEQLGQKAMQLGKDTSFSASEAASAIEELVKAGVSVPDVMNGAADATVALAEAGQINLKDAATVMSDVMNQFKMDAQELPHVADALAGAANASSASVQDLGEAFKYVGPVAKSAGMSFDDTNLALAVLAQNGIRGSEAGTGLRGVLAGLTPTTDKQREAFKELGLITKDGSNIFYDANGKLKPFTEIIGILRDKTKNLSDEEKKTFYEGAFGRNAWPVISALVNTTGEEFSNMAKRIDEVKAADVAAQRMDNFKGSLEKLKGSLETLLIQIGTPLLKAFTDLADGINTVVGWFMKLPPVVQEAGAKFAIFASGLLIAGGTIMKAVAFIAEFKTALATLGIIEKVGGMFARFLPALAAFATGPWGIAIAAVVAIGTALYELYKHNEKFRAFVDGLWASIKDIALTAFDKLKEGVQALVDGFNGVTTATGFIGFLQDVGAAARVFWDALKELWAVWQQTIWPMLKDAASQVWEALKQAWVDMKPALMDLWAALKELWVALAPYREEIGQLIVMILKVVAAIVLWTTKNNLELIVSLIKLATIFVKEVLPPLIKFATFIITEVIPALTKFIVKIIEVIEKVTLFATEVITGFTRAKEKVVETVGGIVAKIDEIKGKISNFVTELKGKWDLFWDGFKQKVVDIWTGLTQPITDGIGLIKETISTKITEIRDSWNQHWDEIKQKAIDIWAAMTQPITDGITIIKDAITSKVTEIKDAWNLFWDGIKQKAVDIWELIKQTVQGGIDGVKGVIDSVTGAIKIAWDGFWNLFGPPVQAAWGLIQSIVDLGIAAVQLAIVTGTNTIKQAWETVWNGIKDFIGPIWDQVKTTVSTKLTELQTDLQNKITQIKTSWQQQWTEISTTAQQIWTQIKDKATEIWTQVKDAILNVVNTVKTELQTRWNEISTSAQQIWTTIKDKATEIWNGIKEAILGPVRQAKDGATQETNTIKTNVEGVWNSIKSSTEQIWNSIKDAVVRAIDSIKTAVTPAMTTVKDAVVNAWNEVKNKTTEIWNSIADAVKGGVDKVVQAATDLKNKIVDAFRDAKNWLLQAGKDLVQGFIDGITSKIHEAEAKIRELTDKVKQATTDAKGLNAKSPSKVFFQYGEWTIQGYIDGVDSLIGKAQALLQKFVGMVKEAVTASNGLAIKSPSKIFFQYGNFTIQGFIDGFDSLMPDVRAKVKELVDLVKQFVQEKLKLGSPSKVFHEFGADTIRGFVRGMAEQMPEIRKIIGELRSHFPEVKQIVKDAAQSIKGDLSSINLEQSITNIVDKLKPFSQTLQNLNISDHIKTVVDKLQPIADKIRSVIPQIQSRVGELADKIAPIGDRVVKALTPIADKLRPVADTIKDTVVRIGDHMMSLTDILNRFDAADFFDETIADPRNVRNFLAGQAINIDPRKAITGQPITVQAPAAGMGLPDKVILRVGDQEFNAYVDGRADQLMSRAATLLSRGRK